MHFTDLVATLQLSIGPVILISGVGLILLSLTNRFGRLIDRSRLLTREIHAATGSHRELILAELRILVTRSGIVRAGIALAVLCLLLTALLIIGLFLGALLELNIGALIATIFVLCMLSLVASLLLFLYDINLSHRALWLETPPEAHRAAR